MSNIGRTNFNGGEFTPKLDVGVRIEKYVSGCRRLENMIPTVYGVTTRRPGTELIVAGNGAACYYELTPDPAKIGITTVTELALIGNDGAYPLDGDYELLNNLDLDVAPYNTGTGWPGIGGVFNGGSEFEGTFNGNYFTISNMFIDRAVDGYGLFRAVRTKSASVATVSNLRVDDANLTVAGFSGVMYGQGGTTAAHPEPVFTNCYVSGSITGAGTFLQTGGFTGNTSATHIRCAAEVTLDRNGRPFGNLGGFAGTNDGIYTDCYATGGITGATSLNIAAGGFGASLNGTHTNCYVTGLNDVVDQPQDCGGFLGDGGTTSDCFWDTEVTTQDTDYAGATGKTTAQMYAQATFTNWDFDDVWEIDEGSDYPRHQWSSETNIKIHCQAVIT